MTIRKVPNKRLWTVKSETSGRSFGTYKSKALAITRLKQVEFFKNKKRWTR